MMDLSPTAPLHTVPLASRPLSPWLRLAHVTSVRPEDATHRAYLRTIDDFELVFQFEGASWIWSATDQGSVDLTAGDVAFIPPHFVHGWGHEAGRHIAVHFDLQAKPRLSPSSHLHYSENVVTRRTLSRVPRLALGEPLEESGAAQFIVPLVTKLRAPRTWHERLLPLVELWSRRSVRSLVASLQACEVIGWALRTIAEDGAGPWRDDRSSMEAKILQLVRAIDHPGGAGPRSSIADIAKRAGMGITAFRAAFERTMGRPPHRYFEERRVERAARALVETDHKIVRIAEAEGYDDPYHFSRVFHRVMGMSPRAYRGKTRR
jgi:AraC-like DNA-binding protein